MSSPEARQTPREPLSIRVLSTFGAIRPDERRDTLAAFVTLFGFMAGHALLETARDALFLARLPASLLPWVYLTIAAAALLLTRNPPRVLRRLSNRHELSAWLVFSGGITLAFWVAVHLTAGWVFYALYAWSGVLATLVVVRFWTVLSDRFTVTQAKRLFAVIGSGSVLGAIVGSGLARVLTEVVDARHVVLAAGIVFLGSSISPTLFGPAPGGRRAETSGGLADIDFARVGRLIWDRPYLRRVAIVVLLSTITFTLVDFVFKSTVARYVPDEALGEFFSSVYFTLNLVSLVVQLGAVGWLIRQLGVNAALAIVPALLLGTAVGFVAAAGITTVLLLKGADGSTRYSLYRTGTELLFVPMSVEIRGRVKAVIDVLGQRGGQALGSLLILLTLSLTSGEVAFAVAAAIAAAAWLYLVLDLKRHYLDVFRETLSEEITETRIAFPALDIASLETLLSTLNSPDDRKVVAALDILAEQRKLRVVPALILYHPSSPVVIHALDLFARSGREDFLPIVDRLLSHTDSGVRAASLRVRTIVQADEGQLRHASHDSDAAVRVTALVGLAASGWVSIAEVHERLASSVRTGDAETRVALARAIRYLPTPGLDPILLALATGPDEAVQLEAVRAMREVKSPQFVQPLVQLLEQRTLRDEVRATLVAFGTSALTRLASALADPTLAHGVRRHLPNTLAAFGTPQAAAHLLRQLPRELDGMVRFKILRGLGRLRSENPGMPLDAKLLREAVDQNMSAAFRVMRWRRALELGAEALSSRQTVSHDMLVALLKDKQSHTLERLFRLFNLLANDEDFLRIYRGLHSLKREARAGSRELVENLVQPPLRRSLLTLIDDLFETASVQTEDDEVAQYEAVLEELLVSGTESLSSLAAYHIGELRLAALRRVLDGLPALSDHHANVVQQALMALEDPTMLEAGSAGG